MNYIIIVVYQCQYKEEIINYSNKVGAIPCGCPFYMRYSSHKGPPLLLILIFYISNKVLNFLYCFRRQVLIGNNNAVKLELEQE